MFTEHGLKEIGMDSISRVTHTRKARYQPGSKKVNRDLHRHNFCDLLPFERAFVVLKLNLESQINSLVICQLMTNNVGLTFSVGDTIMWFTISIEQDNW